VTKQYSANQLRVMFHLSPKSLRSGCTRHIGQRTSGYY